MIFHRLSDERALKEVASCKGASGTKCCVSCQNIISRGRPRDTDTYLKHFTHEDPKDFHMHTAETMKALVRELSERRSSMSAKGFSRLEQCAGLNFNEDAVPFSEYHMELTRLPESLYWDWMHCLVASGGVFQYHLNGVVKVAIPVRVSCGRLPLVHARFSDSCSL